MPFFSDQVVDVFGGVTAELAQFGHMIAEAAERNRPGRAHFDILLGYGGLRSESEDVSGNDDEDVDSHRSDTSPSGGRKDTDNQ